MNEPDSLFRTAEAGMTTAKAPDGREVTTITWEGMTADGALVGQEVNIVSARLLVPGVYARTMGYIVRDMELAGVQ